MKQVTRYHPLLVALHWLIALMIIGMLIGGFFVVSRIPNGDPGKVQLLMGHMIGGVSILTLILIRLGVRLSTARPTPAETGNPLLDKLGRFNHYAFYVIVIVIALSGIATAKISGLSETVFNHTGAPLPEHFEIYPTFRVHAILNLLLAALVILHIVAALWRSESPFKNRWQGLPRWKSSSCTPSSWRPLRAIGACRCKSQAYGAA